MFSTSTSLFSKHYRTTDHERIENDPLFPDDIREAAQKNLEEREITHEIKVYPGIPHGQQSNDKPCAWEC